MTRLAELTEALDALYPPALAEDWDAVGLVCGDPEAPVRRVLFAIDPVESVVAEAIERDCQLLVTHHPLYLSGTSSVAADTPKGRALQALVEARCGLFVAHTNADRARPGVSDALAALFDLQDTVPLDPVAQELDWLVVHVPVESAAALAGALTDAGAGRFGRYDGCTWSTEGVGTFRPLPGARPTVGSIGRRAEVAEVRLETAVPAAARTAVLRALREAHPYETPAFHLSASVPLPGPQGVGRVGDLPTPLTLAALTERAAEVLPATAVGVRAAGAPEQVVRRLAVCGGAGDDQLVNAASLGADAVLTSDLRHHRASEAPPGLALLDAPHWATEWPWLPAAAGRLASVTGVDTCVSTACTDPWTVLRPSAARSPRL